MSVIRFRFHETPVYGSMSDLILIGILIGPSIIVQFCDDAHKMVVITLVLSNSFYNF